MTVTTNYLVTGNGITGSTANAVQALVSGDGILSTFLNAQTHYRLATFGDSRVNTGQVHTGSIASGQIINMDRQPSMLCQVRPDMKLVFNSGLSGATAANWDNDSDTPSGRVTSSKAVSNVLAQTPDAVYMQWLGVNDIIGWNGSSPTKAAMISTIVEANKSCAAAFMGSGVFIIAESINPCGPASATYINGISSAGGWGSNFADKQDMANQVNAAMLTWAASWPDLIKHVDTSSATMGTDGYCKTDGTYYDATHVASRGAYDCALLIDAAIRYKMPVRNVTVLPGTGRSAVRGFWTNPTSGLGEGVAFTADTGAWSAETYSISGEDQIINFNCTALSGGIARRIVDITPLIIGASAKVPVAAADVLQGRIEFDLSDGAGGAPNCYALSLRPRIYYDDASNEFVAFGQPNVTNSTDWPRMRLQSGSGLLTPGLAVKAAMSNSNVTTSTRFQLLLYANTIGATQLKLRRGEWRKVA